MASTVTHYPHLATQYSTKSTLSSQPWKPPSNLRRKASASVNLMTQLSLKFIKSDQPIPTKKRKATASKTKRPREPVDAAVVEYEQTDPH